MSRDPRDDPQRLAFWTPWLWLLVPTVVITALLTICLMNRGWSSDAMLFAPVAVGLISAASSIQIDKVWRRKR